MLEDLHSGFTILDRKDPTDRVILSQFLQRFPSAPKEYLDLVQNEATEIELQTSNGKYLRIWGPADSIDQDEGYEISTRIRGAIPIGDNGGGQVIIYLMDQTSTGLYKVGYGDLDVEAAQVIAPSLTALLQAGLGADLV